MKASVFTWEYPPAIYGGAGVHAKYITTALAKRIKVEVRTLEVGPKPEIEGVNVLRYQSTLRGLATGDPRILKALQVLSFNMNMVADPIDAAIVHTHTWYTNFAGAMAKRIYGAKLVATVHSLEPLRPWKREQLGAGYELSLWMERDGLLACDAVIAVSRDMKADIQKAYPIPASRVAVIHNGVDPQKYCPRDGLESVEKFSIRRPYVFFVGRLSHQKGIFDLVAAMDHVPEGTTLVLATGKPDTPEIEADLRSAIKSRNDVVWIRDMLEDHDLVNLYNEAAVFACPSVYEPFGIINLEAMACETPVVATRVGGIKEVVVNEETGLLVPPGEPAKLGRAITRILEDRALLSKTGIEAFVFFLLQATDPDTGARPIQLPLSIASARLDPTAFELEADRHRFYVMEAERRESFARFVVDAFRRAAKVPTESGDSLNFHGEGISAFRGASPIPGGDTSNVVLRITTGSGDVVLKSYKFLDTGNREPDILARLHARKFPHVARFLGEVALGRGVDRLVLGVATEHIEADDLFAWLYDGWRHTFDREVNPNEDFEEATLDVAADLGEPTRALHDALVDRHPGFWHPEPFTEEDFRGMFKSATRSLGAALRRLGQLAHAEEPSLAESARMARTRLLELRAPIEETLRHLEAHVGGVKSVIHSDLHLAQVLRRRADGVLLFIDFEGEPERVQGERGRKLPPLRDVGSMVRSFAYVRNYVIRDLVRDVANPTLPPEPGVLLGPQEAAVDRMRGWEEDMVGRFTGTYLSHSTLHHTRDGKEAGRLIHGWAMEKALYELEYELKHRVANFPIPLEGIAALAGASHSGTD